MWEKFRAFFRDEADQDLLGYLLAVFCIVVGAIMLFTNPGILWQIVWTVVLAALLIVILLRRRRMRGW